MSRAVWLFALALTSGISFSQSKLETDPEKVAPQLIINVRKHPLGADMLEVTAASAKYPMELLKAQCEKVGENLGSPVRGLAVYKSSSDPKFTFIKASFAADGLIVREQGAINLQSLIRAFLGAAEPYAVRSFLVTFEGESPVDGQTLRDYSSKSVSLKANVSTFPKGLEYRILVLTQDPQALEIPSRYAEPPKASSASSKKPAGTPAWLVPTLIAVAGLAGGALVYFAVSGRGRSSRGPSNRRT